MATAAAAAAAGGQLPHTSRGGGPAAAAIGAGTSPATTAASAGGQLPHPGGGGGGPSAAAAGVGMSLAADTCVEAGAAVAGAPSPHENVSRYLNCTVLPSLGPAIVALLHHVHESGELQQALGDGAHELQEQRRRPAQEPPSPPRPPPGAAEEPKLIRKPSLLVEEQPLEELPPPRPQQPTSAEQPRGGSSRKQRSSVTANQGEDAAAPPPPPGEAAEAATARARTEPAFDPLVFLSERLRQSALGPTDRYHEQIKQSVTEELQAAEEAHKAAAEAEAAGSAAAEEVSAYEGFTEHTYRLLFPHEDHFPGKTPALLTILESGVIETAKIVKCEKERGLIAYRFPQTLDGKTAHTKVEADSPLMGTEYCDTNFVSKRKDGTFCLVQTWPTTYNEKFKADFKISPTNPDPTKFIPQAVTEFKECMERLFGMDAKKLPVLFCHKALVNEGPTYLGKAERLIELLKNHPEKMHELAIEKVDGSLSFVAVVTDGKGKQGTKKFTMAPQNEYVMYKKVGWETMGCVKPKSQFLGEADLGLPRQL